MFKYIVSIMLIFSAVSVLAQPSEISEPFIIQGEVSSEPTEVREPVAIDLASEARLTHYSLVLDLIAIKIQADSLNLVNPILEFALEDLGIKPELTRQLIEDIRTMKAQDARFSTEPMRGPGKGYLRDMDIVFERLIQYQKGEALVSLKSISVAERYTLYRELSSQWYGRPPTVKDAIFKARR